MEKQKNMKRTKQLESISQEIKNRISGLPESSTNISILISMNQNLLSETMPDFDRLLDEIGKKHNQNLCIKEPLQKFLDRLDECIADKKKKENSLWLKEFFMELANHSDEIAEIINVEDFLA